MLNVFTWLRQSVKNAVLGGVADAVAELDSGDDTAAALGLLRQRLQALPAPEEETPVATTNGKRRRGE